MQITTGNKTITYSITPRGNFMRTIETKVQGIDIMVSHSTSDASQFLGLMLCDEAEKQREKHKRELFLLKSISFWERHDENTISGSFNLEHYKKVLAAKGVSHD
jgi:hypothetical protein